MRRIVKWVLGLTVVLAAFVFIGVPLLANTESGRGRVADVLGDALGRKVTLADLEVGFFFTSLDVDGLAIANPEGYPEGPMLKARSLHMDVNFRRILEGTVKGTLSGDGLEMNVLKKGGGTNLDGFAGEDEDEDVDAGGGGDMDVELRLEDSRLTVEDLDKGEKLTVDGVGLEMRLTNRKGERDFGLKIRIRSIDNETLRVRDIVVDARQSGDFLELEKLQASLGGAGRLEGSGKLRVKGGDDWAVRLDAKAVSLDAQMRPFVASVWPFAAAHGGQLDGRMDAGFELEGKGLTWAGMKPHLKGTGRVAMTGLRLPAESLLAQLSALAGREGGEIGLNDAGAQFRVADGWLRFQRISASGKEARYDLAGSVSLDGKLDLEMDLMPLVKQFGGGKSYREVAKYTDKLPIRIQGTTAAPKWKPPKVEDLAKGALEKELEKGLGDVLDKVRKK